MSKLPWVRVSNGTQDPETKCSLAQDQIVKIVGEDGDYYRIQTIEGQNGRVPMVLTLPIFEPFRKPGQLIYCSTDSYTSVRTDDFSFAPNSVFVASPSKSHEGYLEGHMVTDKGVQLGTPGLLPDGYLVHLACPSDVIVSGAMTPSFTTNFDEVDVKFRQAPAAITHNYSVQPYARSIYAFNGEFENELSFTADEIINIRRRIDAEWLEGSIGSGRSGIFPVNFVQIIVNLPEDDDDSGGGSIQQRRSTVNENDGIGFANVKHAFNGRHNDELSVSAGDTVRVIQMVNDEWVMCMDPNTEKTGIVPVGFLEVYLDEEDDDNASKKIPDATFSTFGRNSFVAPSAVPDWRTSTRIEPTAPPQRSSDWATFDNSAITTKAPTQWATFGEEWIAPSTQKMGAAPARPPPPKQSSLQSPNDVVSVTEMFGVAERSAPPRPNAPATMFTSSSDFELRIESATDGISSDDEKRCKVLEELINSELQFITDITTYVDAIDTSTLLSTKHKTIMRNGCAQIVQLSGNLITLLTNEQSKPVDSQQIGVCFLQLRKPFAQTYGYYFRNIEHINALINSSKHEKTMDDALTDLVVRMRNNGAQVIDGPTAIGRPVQRCLKYPLFLNEIVKLTPLNHPDHPKLLEAGKTMSNLGQKMNESKRRKELTKKYMTEDRQTFGEMLSKMTLHSLKKKSNRFTYRMGSSLGVVKLMRDGEFDQLVCDLDSAERRLVRFNYMLIIYRKKVFHETRLLLNKKLVEPRKKVVPSANLEGQLNDYNERVRKWSASINSRVRDEIVKALRNIPKRLIKKRNDKLMDYEAARTKEKSSGKRDFVEIQKDYEALNTQVKQELPKVIEYLTNVLANAMKLVSQEDKELMDQLRVDFERAKQKYNDEPAIQARLLVTNTSPCFVDSYDPDRLKPLQKIANKALQNIRQRARSASPTQADDARDYRKSALGDDSWLKTQSKASLKAERRAREAAESMAVLTAIAESATPSEGGKFRPQNAEERKMIIEKASQKGRLNDMFVVTTHYPQDTKMLKLALAEGKLLIVKKDDLVLAVNRDVPSMWLCYNGYYNAMLPSNILKPYQKVEVGVDIAKMMKSEPKSVTFSATATTIGAPPPQQQKSQNLIDLEDIFGGGSSGVTPSLPPTQNILSQECLRPTSSQQQQQPSDPILDWNEAAKTLPFAPAPPPANFATNFPPMPSVNNMVQSPIAKVNYDLDESSLFDGVKEINWGAAPASQMYTNTPEPAAFRGVDTMTGAFNPSTLPAEAPPPLPVIVNPNLDFAHFTDAFSAPAPVVKFPVSFEDSPISHLPPTPFGTNLAPSIQQRSASAIAAPTNQWPMLTRSDSPQPLIPSRPAPTVKNNVYPSLPASYDFPPLQPTPIAPTMPPTYSMVPNETSSMLYSAPPMYDITPQSNPTGPASLYDAPPTSSSLYDQPPTDSAAVVPTTSANAVRPVICEVRVDYEFAPQGSNQVAVKESEVVGVLQRTDDDGNPEWLLVKRSNGQVGYVPAAYCRPV